MKLFVFYTILYGLLIQWSATETVNSQLAFCMDLNPQNSLDIDYILGMWFGNEVIQHYDNPELTDNEIKEDNSCVVIHLSEETELLTTTPKSRNNRNNYNNNGNNNDFNKFHTIKLIWDERDNVLEYTLHFNDTRRGYWMSSGARRSTIMNLPESKFIGTVQVMKAVGSHLVLTFCNASRPNKLSTIILSRQPASLSNEELTSIKKYLTRRSLKIETTKKVCLPSGATKTISLSLFNIFILSVISKIFIYKL